MLKAVVSSGVCAWPLGGRDAAPRVGACFIGSLCVAPWSVTVGLGQVVCAGAVRRARPLARHRLRDERQRYRRQREGQRERRSMTPAGRVF